MMQSKAISRLAGGFALALASTLAGAHTVWLEPLVGTVGGYEMKYGGHGGELETYDSGKIVSIDVYDAGGGSLDYERTDVAGGGNTQLLLPKNAALVAIHFDNGIWTRDPMGRSVNKPLSAVPGATAATNALKYHKTVLQWSPLVTRELGQRFEVLPLSDSQPRAGQPMQVKVLLDGKPLSGVKLGRGEEGDAGETGADGIATFVPEAGFNGLWAGKRFAVDDPEFTELSYEYLFGFEAL
ncbi:DUF4198 domain-containing protein [Parahaliea aestuarii]|uniref:DUF4198 domain-containing protein n=1 Tax=Parahaliea aestuarii TaxID=1852021 RepID=A0A5C8ZZ08_9GAMM|nr:DUF4198 domain-containing protein [Parahaliea aestuarii]TXS92471.1 DUF4198 domain-containing protein [Parahaliea aestuarii]